MHFHGNVDNGVVDTVHISDNTLIIMLTLNTIAPYFRFLQSAKNSAPSISATTRYNTVLRIEIRLHRFVTTSISANGGVVETYGDRTSAATNGGTAFVVSRTILGNL